MTKRSKPAPVAEDVDEDEETSEAAASTSEEKPKKPAKKASKKPAAKATSDDDDEVEVPAKRKGGPAFARHFPEDPALDALLARFDEGNYAAVREGAAKLAQESDDDEVKRAAKELLSRIEPDPLAKVLVLGAALLLAILSGWYWTHPHVP